MYEWLLNGLGADEAVYFADAVHPEYQTKPSYGWVKAGSNPAATTTAGRGRVNIHAALNLETFDAPFVEPTTVDGISAAQLLAKIKARNPDKRLIHVIWDNAAYHKGPDVREFLARPECRIHLIQLPTYCPHLNPIERLWAVSDLATEQATLLEELRGGARQAAVARLGLLAARGALRRLAAERRSTMLRDVEEAFVTMTAPAWTGVDVWSEAQGEKLVGIQPDGSAVPVELMSTGKMGQLYFSLRLAGYRSFARDLGPLPMILDDIMETFDDTRAQAASKLCAVIGANGQAILFTHHAHLVELARDCIKGVSVVNMPD